MKNRPSKKPAGRGPKSNKLPAAKQSAAARHLGGQPENDQDARDAGFESATAGAAGKPEKPSAGQNHTERAD